MTGRYPVTGTAVLPFAGAALSGLAQVLVYPRFSWEWLAPLCLVPLLLAVRDIPAKRRFLVGWLSGAVFWGGTCYWIYPVMRDYASITPAVAGILFVFFFLLMGISPGAFALIAGRFLHYRWAVPALAGLWVAMEGSYQHTFFSFTWTQLGNASLDFPLEHIARLAPWTGIYGPSLVFALANAAVAVALVRRSWRPMLALAPVAGVLLLPPLPADRTGPETARLVQPNVHPDLIKQGWLAENGTEHLRTMLEMSKAAKHGDRPSLLVWSEYPVSFYYFDDQPLRKFLERVALESGAAFVFNTISFEGGDRLRPRNSSVTLDRNGAKLSQYSKIHLVPFGEYVPWPFSLFVEKITMQAGTFQPGDEIALASVDGHRVGTFICYESVFGRSIRKFTANGAELLVNISNDSWYGRSAARDQHLLVARMRAAENGRWILRATNDGITSAISPAGRVAASLPPYVQEALDVRFEYLSHRTPFVRYGEWLWWACLLGAVIALASDIGLRRRAALQ